ncbi:MAG: SigE family RNA polymerase sigma factor [Mycobacteriales bacterium]
MHPEREDGFRDFVTAQWSPLVRLAVLLVGDRQHAEDLVQTVLAKVWTSWPRLATEAPEAYARKALTNTAISWWRRKWHGEEPTSELPDGAAPDDADVIARRLADRRALVAALGALPPRQRAVVVLRFAEDLSELQVAATLNCSVGTVKSLTSRGLAKLRADGLVRLEDNGDNLTPAAEGTRP